MKNAIRSMSLAVVLLLSVPVWSQVKVTGIVYDDLNDPTPGVTIKEVGTNNGVVTDIDGKYTITVKDSHARLKFSYIGFEPQTVTVGKHTKLNVTLHETSTQMNDVVVVGYGSMKKRDVTGAVTTYRPEEIEASKVISVNDMLQGKVAGLSVSATTDQPGAASSLIIRGSNSLRGDNQPLVVIDNIPQSSIGEFASAGDNNFEIATNPLTSLNPNDIESIEILKDASATAIYGSRGANGVILVKTKSGSAGRPKIQASANWSIVNASHLLDMFDLVEYAQYNNIRTGGYPAEQPIKPNGEWNTFYPYYIDGNDVYRYNGDDTELSEKWSLLEYRNWQKEVYSQALQQNYSASVSGGNDRATYFASAAFKDVDGLVRGTGLKQGDIRINLNTKLAKSLSLALSVNGSVKENNMMAGGNTVGGATGAISGVAITAPPYERSAEELARITNTYDRATIWTWIDEFDDKTTETTFRGSLDLGWDICSWLKYDLRAGGNINNQSRDRWYGIELYQGSIQNGYVTLRDFKRSNYTVENVFTANKDWDGIVSLNAVAGVTYDAYNSLSKVTVGNDFSDYSLRSNGLHLANNVEYKQPSQNDYQLLSFLARVNLAFLDSRYLLTASFRADGSSKFAKGNRWAYFPSATIAWRMEQEKWLQNVGWINQLKLRFGYGSTGSQSINAYCTVADYATASTDGTPFQGAAADGTKLVGVGVNKLANSSLKWETTNSFNFGIDFGFFHDRLTGTIDLYQKNTTDLLIDKQLPSSAGFSYITINQGNMRNRGIELTLNGEIIRSKNWTWSLGGNIAFNDPKIVDFGLPTEQWGYNDDGSSRQLKAYLGNSLGNHFGAANIFAVGYAPGMFYGYQTDGIIQENDPYLTQVTSSIGTLAPGNYKFVDRNKDGKIDENDRTFIGNPNPKFTYGFRTKLKWKDLSLSMDFNGVYGNDIFNANARYYKIPSNSNGTLLSSSLQDMYCTENPWRAANASQVLPSANSIIPKVAFDAYIEDGSYLRCSDITLAYDLPKRWMHAIHIQGIGVFFSVKNAFIVTNYSGFDPEVNTFAFDGTRPGIDLSSYPHTRSFVLGLNVSL